MIWLYFVRLRAPAPPGHECPGYASTEKPGEPGSWRSGSDFGAGFSRLFVSHVAQAFMPGREGAYFSTTSTSPFTFGAATVCVRPEGQVTSIESTFWASPRPK